VPPRPRLPCRLRRGPQPGGISASPSYGRVRFTDIPDAVPGGGDGIDAAVISLNVDGVIVAFRGTVSPEWTGSPATFLQSLLYWLNDARAVLVPGYRGHGAPGVRRLRGGTLARAEIEDPIAGGRRGQ
jgi:hypothetical protein